MVGAIVTGPASLPAAAEPGRKPLVVCTTTMIADLATQIGGDRVNVVGIMKPKTDPHIYEPTPDDAMLLRKADLILYNGLHLEGKMVQMIENAGSKAVALANDPRIKLRGMAGGGDAPDPHCWWSARYFMIYTEGARDALYNLDRDNAEFYQERTLAYLNQLRQAEKRVREAIKRIPEGQRVLVTSHDAFYYYGEAYGLEVNAVLGISTDAEVRALRVNELANLVTERKVPAIFHETSVSAALNQMIDRVVEVAARDGHTVRVPAEPLYSDSLDAPGTPAGTYIGALLANTRIIVSALSGQDAGDIVRPLEGGS
ncbi:MAG TPA: zinc ABC transporter substrate-binding protein [Candidatus Polarisedimenticolia bacterium]|nr:zinc ABC transporter substrate-binding protein [Candidatus Polarisedimenticolia bacterium]